MVMWHRGVLERKQAENVIGLFLHLSRWL